MWQVPVGKDFRVSAVAVARALTRNTVLVVASAPCFPHGVVDDVAGIARVRVRCPPPRNARWASAAPSFFVARSPSS